MFSETSALGCAGRTDSNPTGSVNLGHATATGNQQCIVGGGEASQGWPSGRR